MTDSTDKPKRLSREAIYKCRWVNLYVDRVLLPNGRVIDQYHVIEFNNDAVGAVVENEENELLFVNAYRYPINCIDWEIPTGRMEDRESPEEGARREILEESGYETSGHQLLYTFHPINGISNETFHVVKCKAGDCVRSFDTDEVAGVKWVSKEKARRMIIDREITDGFTLTALLLVLGDWSDNG